MLQHMRFKFQMTPLTGKPYTRKQIVLAGLRQFLCAQKAAMCELIVYSVQLLMASPYGSLRSMVKDLLMNSLSLKIELLMSMGSYR